MSKVRDVDECPTCKKAPSSDQRGRLVCDCPGKLWGRKAGIAGSPEDQALLEQHGWQLNEMQNDTFWSGPVGNILYLHEGDRWYCETAPKRFAELKEYLEWYSDGMREFRG